VKTPSDLLAFPAGEEKSGEDDDAEDNDDGGHCCLHHGDSGDCRRMKFGSEMK
jgi:hypothetical protein